MFIELVCCKVHRYYVLLNSVYPEMGEQIKKKTSRVQNPLRGLVLFCTGRVLTDVFRVIAKHADGRRNLQHTALPKALVR